MDFTPRPKDDADRAYHEGQHAREIQNLSILDNPYRDGSELAEAWAEGYYDADAQLQE